MIVRTEEPTDVAAIHAVVAAAFKRKDEADLVDRLREQGDSVISLVALDGDKLVGHILFSRMNAPFRIGSRLIRAGLGCARQGGWQGVFVLGDPAYYRRFGFDTALASGFQSPYRGPDLMALALGATLPITMGTIEYASGFHSLA